MIISQGIKDIIYLYSIIGIIILVMYIKELMKPKKCFKCKKPCYGYLCKKCYKIHGSRLSNIYGMRKKSKKETNHF